MATVNSSADVNLSAIGKMKVAELKKELKSRGLSTAGSKTELVERLQSAGSQVAQDVISEDGNADTEMLDEDEVLGGEEEGGEFDDDDLAADAVLSDEPKVELPPTSTISSKRPASSITETSQDVQPKKRVLVRNSVTTSSGKENGSEDKNANAEVDENKTVENGKKIVKLSGITVKERLELRAQKFGVPLSEAAKKEARAARFGVTSNISSKTNFVGPSEDVLKKRAERFGINVSSLALNAEASEKLKKRQERFGITAPSSSSLEEKKKLRAERFKL